MYRQFPSRNQRNKGVKVKYALQVVLLVAVCFWLIYQVRHSYDKKRDFDHNGARNSQHVQTNNGMELGRKDPQPQVTEPSTKNEKHDEEADEDTEIDSKADGKEDQVKGGGDVELEGHDQQKSDSELYNERVITDEEKELEGVHEKKNEDKIVADKDSKIETESSEDNLDRDQGTKNTHEAREKHYNGDDASSAVTNEGQFIASDSESSNTQNQTNTPGNENKDSNTVERIVGQNITGSKVYEETAGNGISSKVIPEKGSEVSDSTSQGSIFNNSTVTMESTDVSKSSNDTAEVNTELRDQLNNTEISIVDLSHAHNDTEGKGSNIETGSSELANIFSIVNSLSDSNRTDTIWTGYVESNLGPLSNFSNNQNALDHIAPYNASAETKDASEISVIEGNRDASQSEKSDLSTGADGNSGGSDSSNTENAGKIQNETVDSIVMEDKLPLVDVERLPNLGMEASKSEAAANE